MNFYSFSVISPYTISTDSSYFTSVLGWTIFVIFKEIISPGRPYFKVSPLESPITDAPRLLMTEILSFWIFSSYGGTSWKVSDQPEVEVMVIVEYN